MKIVTTLYPSLSLETDPLIVHPFLRLMSYTRWGREVEVADKWVEYTVAKDDKSMYSIPAMEHWGLDTVFEELFFPRFTGAATMLPIRDVAFLKAVIERNPLASDIAWDYFSDKYLSVLPGLLNGESRVILSSLNINRHSFTHYHQFTSTVGSATLLPSLEALIYPLHSWNMDLVADISRFVDSQRCGVSLYLAVSEIEVAHLHLSEFGVDQSVLTYDSLPPDVLKLLTIV